jgi:hypothetical protein
MLYALQIPCVVPSEKSAGFHASDYGNHVFDPRLSANLLKSAL